MLAEAQLNSAFRSNLPLWEAEILKRNIPKQAISCIGENGYTRVFFAVQTRQGERGLTKPLSCKELRVEIQT